MAKAKRRGQKPNATGRNGTGRFVALRHRMLESNAYRSLSPAARSLLVEIAMLYNGSNNGSLFLSVEDAAHRMGLSDTHASGAAFKELQQLGFIQMTKEAHFEVKAAETSRARTWRLTWEPGPGRRIASWDFLEHEPEPGTQSHKRMERGLRALKRYKKAKDLNKFPVVDSTILEPKEPASGSGFHNVGE